MKKSKKKNGGKWKIVLTVADVGLKMFKKTAAEM